MLLVSIQEEIDDAGISDLLVQVTALVQKGNIRGVIVDLKEVDVVDSYLAGHLERLAKSLKLLRAGMIVVGLKVTAVMSLLAFGIQLEGLDFALDVEQAVERLAE